MTYTAHLFKSSREVPTEIWRGLVAEGDLFMDLRFLSAMEMAWGGKKTFWPVLVLDENDLPVAAACLCLHPIDVSDMGHRWIHRAVSVIRRIWPGFLLPRALVCGVPFSGGQSSLRLAPGADAERVLDALCGCMRKLAWKHIIPLLLVKELDEEEQQWTDALQRRGFLKAESLPMNEVVRKSSFEDWLPTLRSHYRYKLRKSTKKFEAARLTCQHLRGEEILPLYTEAMHQLYTDVVQRHEINFERLPYDFFPQLVRQFPDNVRMTVIRDKGQVLAFSWSLVRSNEYQNVYVGFDYQQNDRFDLYFNLMIRDLSYGLSLGVDRVLLGQTSDVFKSRLGAIQTPRAFYVRSLRPVTWGMRLFSRWLFPAVPAPPPLRELYRDAAAAHQPPQAADGNGVSSNPARMGRTPAETG